MRAPQLTDPSEVDVPIELAEPRLTREAQELVEQDQERGWPDDLGLGPGWAPA